MFGRYLSVCGCLAATLGWAAIADAQQYTLVSVSTAGTQGNGDSTGPVFSPDGKVVAFTSVAGNLVPGDTNGFPDVFVRDLASHTTTRVSVASDGTDRPGKSGIDNYAPNVSLNQDGSIVAFRSMAALDPADTNGHTDIYVRDRTLNQTTRVSVASDNSGANNDSFDPRLSGDGRYVVFTSLASNLASGDNNGVADVFLRDRTTLTTTRLSVSATGGDLNGGSAGGRISADGRIVAFVSGAAIVSDPDPLPCPPAFLNGSFRANCGRAFVLDRSTGTITRVPLPASLSADGAEVRSVEVTPDGRFVLIQAEHGLFSNFSYTQTILAVYDRQTGRVEKDVDDRGLHPAGATISGNGRFLALGVGGVAEAFSSEGLTFDRQTFSLLTEAGTNYDRSFSPDGLEVVFASTISPLPGDQNSGSDIYLLKRDSDSDGMPDSWETQVGLNPNDPSDATLDNDGDGATNLQEYLQGTNPKGTFKRYFAEGAANGFFTTRLGLFNPGDQTATVVLEFLGQNSKTRSEIVTLAAHGWTAVTLGDPISAQPDDSFSTIIDADRQVVADRTMTWDKSGYGSHAETAIAAPATTWYLAEGSTGGSFDLFYQLQNPGDTAANVTVNYLRPSPLPPIVKTYTVAPRTRRTIWVDSEGAELAATDLSAKITADQPILAERAMYFSTPTQPFAAGHEGAAVEAPATSWFLAEGATGSFFDLFLLLANADTTDAQVKVTYLLPSGPPVIKTHTVAAQSRLTINVDNEDPKLLDTPVSTIVESTNSVPVVAERAMWWPSPNWYEAHLSAGSTTTGTKWALADGLLTNTGGSETETYIMIANTSASAGSADVTLFFGDGTTKTKAFPLAANSRVNVQVSVDFPDAVGKGGFGTIIESNGPQIVVERAIYSNANGQTWAAGSDALATRLQ